MKSSIFLSLSGFLVLWSFTACSFSEKQETSTFPTSELDFVTVEREAIPSMKRISGTVRGASRSVVSTRFAGTVQSVAVKKGDFVQKGSSLIRISDADLRAKKAQIQAQLDGAKSQLRRVESDYKRILALYEKQSATPQERDDITAAYESGQSQVATLRAELDEIHAQMAYTQIRAPYSGYVVDRRADPGELALPGKPLLVIEDVNNVEVLASVSEFQVGNIQVGDSLMLFIPVAQAHFNGRITEASPSASGQLRQFDIKVTFEASERIKPGMFAEVLISGSSKQGLSIPRSSLIERGQLKGVIAQTSSGVPVLRWIRIGRTFNERVEVLSGLQHGDHILAHPSGFQPSIRESKEGGQ